MIHLFEARTKMTLPSLLLGAELWTLTSTLLLKLERRQYWFLKHIFYAPEFAPGRLLLKLSGLDSVESEVATKKLLFLCRLITEPIMTPLIKNLFLMFSYHNETLELVFHILREKQI